MRTRSGPTASGQRLAAERALGIERRGDGIGRGGKGGLHRVADHLEDGAAVGRDRLPQQREVTLDGSRHRRAVPLPERGAPLDVREEEGDGAARQVRHASLHDPDPQAIAMDCRMPPDRIVVS